MYDLGRKAYLFFILLALGVVYEDRAGDIPYFLLLTAALAAVITLIIHFTKGGEVRIIAVPLAERDGRKSIKEARTAEVVKKHVDRITKRMLSK
jgi:hypothetical protein